jgi:hypothetical protein
MENRPVLTDKQHMIRRSVIHLGVMPDHLAPPVGWAKTTLLQNTLSSGVTATNRWWGSVCGHMIRTGSGHLLTALRNYLLSMISDSESLSQRLPVSSVWGTKAWQRRVHVPARWQSHK